MKNIFIFAVSAIAIGALYALQTFRIFVVAGTNPNLVLIAFLFFLFSRMGRGTFFALLAAFLAFAAFWTPFWFPDAATLAVLLALAFFLRQFFAARSSVNFFFSLAVAPPLFYGCLSLVANAERHGLAFSSFSLSLPPALLGEIAYDVLLGGAFWLAFRGPLARTFGGKR